MTREEKLVIREEIVQGELHRFGLKLELLLSRQDRQLSHLQRLEEGIKALYEELEMPRPYIDGEGEIRF